MGFELGRGLLDLTWLGILIFALLYFWRQRKMLGQAQTWLKTKGRITACTWVEANHSVWPKIEYSYQVYDKNLLGEHLFLTTFYNNPYSKHSRLAAYKAVLAYKEDSEIDIYYNPNDPEQAVLDVSIPIKLHVILLVISVLLFIHLSVIVVHFLK